MKIADVKPEQNYTLQILSKDGNTGIFDVGPYLELEAFRDLKNADAFQKVKNGGYFIQWECGADLSADTTEAHQKNNSIRRIKGLIRPPGDLPPWMTPG